jgi:proteic killer suppression protein
MVHRIVLFAPSIMRARSRAVTIELIRRDNRLEALKGDRAGQHSIRINDQFRICFVWTREGPTGVEITDYD